MNGCEGRTLICCCESAYGHIRFADATRYRCRNARVCQIDTGGFKRGFRILNIGLGLLESSVRIIEILLADRLDGNQLSVTLGLQSDGWEIGFAPRERSDGIVVSRLIGCRINGSGPDRARVKLLLEDGTPYPLEGTLKFSEVTVDPSTGSFILRMVFPNPEHILLPGMYARAVVEEGEVDRAILVPQQGISRDPKGNPIALIVNGSGKVQQQMITVDRTIGDKWLVSSGLKPGDQVIVEGAQRVRPGASVKVVSFQRAAKSN